MELKMLTKFYGLVRPAVLAKVQKIDAMSVEDSLSIREVGFEALASAILDVFGSLPELRVVTITLDAPELKHTNAQSETRPDAHDLIISINRPVRIDTVGAEIPEWSNAKEVLEDLIPFSKVGAGAFTVTRDMPAVQYFLTTVVNKEADVDYADYRLSVQALAGLADHSFGSVRVINETT